MAFVAALRRNGEATALDDAGAGHADAAGSRANGTVSRACTPAFSSLSNHSVVLSSSSARKYHDLPSASDVPEGAAEAGGTASSGHYRYGRNYHRTGRSEHRSDAVLLFEIDVSSFAV